MIKHQLISGLFEARPTNVLVQGFTHYFFEDAVEMLLGKSRYPSEFPGWQVSRYITMNGVQDIVDA